MSTIDQTIQMLFAKLGERKAKVKELKAQIDKKWITNGTFRLIGSTSTTNIQTASAEVLLEVASHLELLSSAQAIAAQKLGQTIDRMIQNHGINDWYADFAKRQATISLREEEAQLAQLETRLNSVLSPEERRRIEVELLEKELS